MSRTTEEVKNPSSKFIQWSGSIGKFNYWDKEKGEKGEKVFIDLPFKFLVLDVLNTVKGYNDADQSGYWSNEVRDTTKEKLVIRTKKGIKGEGIYKEVVGKCIGAKYCQSVYIAYVNDKKELEIGNIQMMGAAVSSWIDFCKKNKIYKGTVNVAGMTQAKKGATTYQIPNFEMIAATPEVEAKAKELDTQLQSYLVSYLKLDKKDENGEIEFPEHDDNN